MKRKLITILTIFASCLSLFSCQNKEEQNKTETIRIISLAPHITEIIYGLGAEDHLVGVTDFCNYPIEAKQLEKIGGLFNPNTEKMIMLKPTHLFGMPSHEKLNQQLQSFGYNITMMTNEKIDDVLESIRIIGGELERGEQARSLTKNINLTLDSLRERPDFNKRISAVLLIGHTKGSLQNMTVAGKDTYINEIWKLVGGQNIYEDLPTRYGAINLESLLVRDPEVIIEFDMQKERSVEKLTPGPEWELLRDMPVVKNGQIYVVGGNHTMIPGPRMTLLAEDFSSIIRQVQKMKKND